MQGSEDAAGHDLFAAREVIIPPGDRAVVYTDLRVEIPPGCYLRIAPRYIYNITIVMKIY